MSWFSSPKPANAELAEFGDFLASSFFGVILIFIACYYINHLINLIKAKINDTFTELFPKPRPKPIATSVNPEHEDEYINRKCPSDIAEQLKQLSIPLAPILELLECMVCMECVTLPFSQCTIGHLVCGTCVKKITRCPMCEAPIQKEAAVFIKNFVSSVPRLCPHYMHGCGELVTPSEHHARFCRYRLVACREGSCDSQLSAFHLLTHYEVKHPGAVKVSGDEQGLLAWQHFTADHETKRSMFFKASNGVYWLEMNKITNTLIVSFRVILIDGPKPECCVITLECEKNGAHFKYTLMPMVSEEVDDDNNPSMEVSQKYIKQFLNARGDLLLKYELKKRG